MDEQTKNTKPHGEGSSKAWIALPIIAATLWCVYTNKIKNPYHFDIGFSISYVVGGAIGLLIFPAFFAAITWVLNRNNKIDMSAKSVFVVVFIIFLLASCVSTFYEYSQNNWMPLYDKHIYTR